MLNISEENFLSDIPEEKDECDTSHNSCEKILEDSLHSLQSNSQYYAHLHLLQSLTVKKFWCSLEGLARDVKQSNDLHHLSRLKGTISLEDLLNTDVSISRPLER